MVLRMMMVAVMAVGLGACLDDFERADQGTALPDPNDPDPNDPDPNDPDPNDPDPNDPDPNDPDPNDPDPNDPDPNDPDPSDPEPNDPDPNDPDPNDPNDPNDPIGPVEARAWCVPEAAPASPSLILPDVPAEVFDRACALSEDLLYRTYNQSLGVIRYIWESETVLWIEYDNGDPTKLQKVTFDDAGHRVEAIWGIQKWSGGLVFATYEDAFRFRWDARGNLLETAVLRGGRDYVTMVQRVADGRPVERHEERYYYDADAGESRPTTLTSTWTWDGDRLIEARASGFGHSWHVIWAYDAAGRPVAVKRQRDGVTVSRMTWSYDADNRLAGRSVMRDSAVIREDGFDPASLDTFGLAADSAYDHWLGDPWDNAVPRVAERGCLMPPTSDAYGYPGDEAAYQLGMPRDERPAGIGFAYGASTYGWNYGDLSWYAHTGVHGFEPDYYGYYGPFESELRYVAGRMVEETIHNPNGPVTRSHRTRTFTDGRLATDRLEFGFRHWTPEGEPVPEPAQHARELRFTWGGGAAAPTLTRRELHDDALGLLEWQESTFDAQGRWLSHTIHGVERWGSAAALSPYDSYSPCDEAPCDGTTHVRTRYERALDPAGRMTERTSASPDQAGVLQVNGRERWTYDAAGRLVEERTNETYTRRFDYDEAGRLVYESWDYDGHGDSPDGWTTTAYDDRGRWILRETYSGGTLHNSEARVFSCELDP